LHDEEAFSVEHIGAVLKQAELGVTGERLLWTLFTATEFFSYKIFYLHDASSQHLAG
jgi:hypothetical protein